MPERLFTPRFLIMFSYSFTVFVSLFQLLPTAPYRILDLGGSTLVAGLFLGLLTYSSALSAPVTGPIGDRVGQRRVLMTVSLVLVVCSMAYSVITDHRVMLVVVVVHGLFWSALLSASGAYMTATIPASRRAEGLSYWGLASVSAIAAAPALGFWVFQFGWFTLCVETATLNLLLFVIAWRLPDDRRERTEQLAASHPAPSAGATGRLARFVEWRVLVLSITMGMISYGYGSLTTFSALYADALGLSPRSLFLTTMAVAILVGRLTVGRTLDRLGYRRVLLPCLVAPSCGLLLLAFANGLATFVAAAVVFGTGFGLMYPAYTAYVMGHVSPLRRGAAFGAMLAAFDTGIGTGSSTLGWLIENAGFRPAFGAAAGLALLALPFFLLVERRLGFRATG